MHLFFLNSLSGKLSPLGYIAFSRQRVAQIQISQLYNRLFYSPFVGYLPTNVESGENSSKSLSVELLFSQDISNNLFV